MASEAFAESGTTSLNAIAKRAGVGAGTLYRHFPTREDLILAVYQRDVQRLVDSVPDILAEHPPLDSFRIWFLTLADYIRVKHGLGDALYTAAARTSSTRPTPRSSRRSRSCSGPARTTAACAAVSTPATCSCSWASCGAPQPPTRAASRPAACST